MNNINILIQEYIKLNKDIKTANESIKTELSLKINSIAEEIKEKLKKEYLSGNISEEFIQIYGMFDAIVGMEENPKDNNEIQKENFNGERYTLKSNKIISLYTGEEIDVSNLSRIEKIKTIYENTGIEISIQDSEIVKLCELRFQQFLSICSPSKYEKMYGSDWEKKVEKIYKNSYLLTAKRCIANGLNEVDEKNSIQKEQLLRKIEDANKEKAQLSSEIDQLKTEIAKLNDAVDEINKKRQEEYRKVMLTMVKNNSEDVNRFYSDGILKPDDDITPGIYTTYRIDRSDETGMQQRVNDAVLVHTPLTSEQLEARVQMSALANISDEEFKAYQERNGVIEDSNSNSHKSM